MKGNIFIIGTSHVAQESILKIRSRILEIQPDIIAVELDEGRLRYLFDGNKKEKITFDILKRFGVTGFLFGFIGRLLQQKLGEKTGLVPGQDMKTACLLAKQLNAKLCLIDRPIEVTLGRLSRKINFWEKIKFTWYVLCSTIPKNSASLDLNKIPDMGLIYQLLTELKTKFPNFYKVLVEERDSWLASQIKFLSERFPDKKIVAVVGAGHINGIREKISCRDSRDQE